MVRLSCYGFRRAIEANGWWLAHVAELKVLSLVEEPKDHKRNNVQHLHSAAIAQLPQVIARHFILFASDFIKRSNFVV